MLGTHMQINKEAKQFRTKGCPLFDELEIIYGDTTATGENAGASTQGAIDTDDENNGVPLRNQTSPDQDLAVDLDDDADFVETSTRAQSRTPHRRRGQKGASSFDQASASLTKYYENKVGDEAIIMRIMTNSLLKNVLHCYLPYRMLLERFT